MKARSRWRVNWLTWTVMFVLWVVGSGKVWADAASFTTAGTNTWTCPPGINSISVAVQGGGGGGGKAAAVGAAAGGGGGSCAYTASLAVTPGNIYTVVVGVAGSAGTSVDGGAGGASSFSGSDISTLTAGGGGGGKGTANGSTAGTAGTASGGGVNNSGGAGHSGGGAGGSAGTTGGGGTASGLTGGLAGSGSPAGVAGANAVSDANGTAGTAPGGGGSGGVWATAARNGGAGAAGQVVINYISPDYRSAGNGDWSTPGTWEYYNGSAWVTAAVKPVFTNHVYIQYGHTVTLTANESCCDLSINTGQAGKETTLGKVALDVYTLSVHGKLRCYYGAVGTVPGTSSTAGYNVYPFTANSSAAKVSIVGFTRLLVSAKEWSSTITTPTTGYFPLEINLSSGQTAMIGAGISVKPYTGSAIHVAAGTLDAGSSSIFINTGSTGAGDFTVDAGAIFRSAKSGAGGGNAVTARDSANRAGTFTIDGLLQLSGATPNFAMNAVVLNGTVEYTRANAQTLAGATASGATSPTYNNLKLSGSNAKTLVINTTVNGTLTIADTASLALSTFTLTYGGSSTLEYAGPAAQTTTTTEFPAGSGGPGGSPSVPQNLKINNAAGVTLNSTKTINGKVTLTTGQLKSAGNLTLGDGASIVVNNTGTAGSLDSGVPTFGASVNVTYTGTTAIVTGNELPALATVLTNLTINNAGGVTLNASRTVNGSLALNGGALSIGANVLTLNGAVSSTSGTLTGGGSSDLTIGGAGASTTLPTVSGGLRHLTMNRANGISLGGNVSIAGALTLTSGLIDTGANTLTLTSTGSVSGASSSSYINGKLARGWGSGVTGAKMFPIGKNSNYRPLTINYTALTGASTVTAEQNDPGTFPGSFASVTPFASRYWTVTESGSSARTYDITLDGNGFTAAGTAVILKYDNPDTTKITATGTAPDYIAPGLTSFSDFGLGDLAGGSEITVTGGPFSFGSVARDTASAEKTNTVSGTGLTGDITNTPPAGFEISTTSGSGFSSSPIVLTQSGGTVSATPIYVRFKPAAVQSYDGSQLTCASPGATTRSVTLNGTGTAATRTASVSGDWNQTATWGGNSIPVAGDIVIIGAGVTVTVPSSYSAACATIDFTTDSGAASIVLADTTASLAASGAVTIQRNGSSANTINVGAGTFTAASVALQGTTGGNLCQILISTGTATVSGNITSAGVDSRIEFSGAGTINVGGSFLSGTTGTMVSYSGSTVNYIGAGAQTVGAYAYTNLTLSGSGAKDMTGVSTVAGSLTVTNSATVANNGTLAVGTLEYRSSGSSTLAGNVTGNSLLIDGTGGTLNLGSSLTHTFSGGLTLAAGTLHGGSSTLKVAGNASVSGGSFTGGTGTVEWNGGSQTIAGVAYNNIVLSGNSTVKTAGGNISIAGNLNVPSTIELSVGSTYTLDVTGATTVSGTLTLASTGAKSFTGNVTVNAGGIWNETGISTYLFGGNLQNDGTFTANTGIHTNSGIGKIFGGFINITNLTITGTYTNTGTLTVNTSLAGSGGTLIQGENSTLNFGQVSIGPSLNATAAGNTVNYYRVQIQNVKTNTYCNLTVSGSNIKTIPAGAVTVNGVFSMEGTATIAFTGTLSYGPNATLRYNRTAAYTNSSDWPTPFSASGGVIITNTGAITLDGAKTLSAGVPLTIHSGATLDTSASDYVLTIGGALTNNGVINLRGATTHTCDKLLLGGLGRNTGSWGSSSSAATYTNNTHFIASAGYITVATDARSTPTVTTWPTASQITEPQALSASTLTGGAATNSLGASVTGTYAFDNPGDTPAAGTASHAVTFTPSDLGTYKPVGGSVSVTVNPGATTRTATSTGNWNDTGTWSGGVVPYASDYVVIGAGVTVTVPSGYSAACATIDFTADSGASSIVLADGTASLAASGAVTIQRNGSADNTINVGAGTFTAASVALQGTTGGNLSQILISTGTATVSGNITSAGTDSKIAFSGAGTINVGGSFLSGTTGTFVSDTGSTVNYNGAGAQTVGIYSYNNLILSGSGAKTMTGVTTVGGNLTVTNTATMTDAGSLTIGGTLNYDSTSGTTLLTGNVTGVDLTMNGAGGTLDLGSGLTHTFSGNWTRTAGTINGGSSTLKIGGSVSGSGGTFTAGTGTVEWNGGAQALAAITYNHLILSGSGAKTMTGVTGIGGNLTLSGTVTADAIALAVGGNLSVGSGTTLTVPGVVFSVAGTTVVGGTLVHSSATGAKTYSGNVTISSGGIWNETAAVVLSFGGNLQNDGTFTASSGIHTFSGASKIISGTATVSIPSVTISGSYTNNGIMAVTTALAGAGSLTQGTDSSLSIVGTPSLTTLDASSSGNTVNYSGAAQTVKDATYYHLTLSGSGSKALSASVIVNGVLSMEGTAAAATAAPTYGSNASLRYNKPAANNVGIELVSPFTALGGVTITNTGVVSFGANGKVFNDGVSLVIKSGATLDADNKLTFGGDFINDGTLSGGSFAITITGAVVQSIGRFETSGTVTMSKTGGTATFTGNVTGGALTINGDGGTLALGSGLTHVFSGNWTRTAGTLHGGSSVLKIGGNVSGSGGAFVAGTGTVEWDKAGTQTIADATYNHLIISGSSTKSLNGAIVVGGDLTIGAGTTLDTTSLNSYAVTLGGNLVINGIFTARSSVVTINGVGAQSIAGFTTAGGVSMTKSAGTATFQGNVSGSSLTLNGAGGTLDLGAGLTHTFSGGWTRTAGTLNGGSSTLKIGGSVSGTGGTFTAGTGTVEWYAAGAQTLAGVSYHHLVLSGSGAKTMTGISTVGGDLTVSGSATMSGNDALSIAGSLSHNSSGSSTLAGNLSIGGNLTVAAGVLDLSGYTVDRTTSGGALSVSAGATLAIGSTSYFPANYSTVTLDAASTVNFNKAGDQTVSTQSYGNLKLSGSGGKDITSLNAIAGNLLVTGAVTTAISAGSVLQVDTVTVKNSGEVTNHVTGSSGGLDVTNALRTALVVTNSGRIRLAFEGDSTSIPLGDVWGLRWAGTNGYPVLTNAVSLGLITATNQMTGPWSNQPIMVYRAGNSSYTYIGFRAVPGPVINGGAERVDASMSEDGGALDLGSLLTAVDDYGTSWTWTNTTTAANGTVVCSGAGTNPVTWTPAFTYTPAANFNGTNSFLVRVLNDLALVDSITVSVVVAALNDPPTNTTLPGISGNSSYGSQWTVTNGVWNDNLDTNGVYTHDYFLNNAVFTYQWQYSNAVPQNILNETNATFTPTLAMLGTSLCVQVTCWDAGNGTPATTNRTATTAYKTVTAPSLAVFNKASSDWATEANWTPAVVLTTNITAVIGDMAVASPAVASIASGDCAAKNLILGTNANSSGTLNLSGGTLLGNGALTLGSAAGSTGILSVTGSGVITNFTTLSIGSLGRGEMTLADGGVAMMGAGALKVAAGGDSAGTLTLSSGALLSLGNAVDTLQIGAGSNSIGRVNVNGGTLYRVLGSARAWRIGYGVGSTGVLTITSGVVSNEGTGAFSVGYANNSVGEIHVQGGRLSVDGVTTLGVAPGSRGEVQVSGGTWALSKGLLVGGVADATGLVTVANCTQTNISGAVAIGAGGYGILTVSNATVGDGAAVVVTNNGYVVLSGTGSVFRVNTLAVKNNGVVSNHVSQHAGGIDITNVLSTSLVITDGGKIHLSFDQNPVAGGDFWGLRWKGTNGYPALTNAVSTGLITWTNQLTGYYSNATLRVYKAQDNGYTYVGLAAAPSIDQGSQVTLNVNEDSGVTNLALALALTATDDGAGGAGVTWTPVTGTGPSNGTLVCSGGSGTNPITWTSFTYRPDTNWSGTDGFVLQATDSLGASNRITVSVAVAPVNDAPVNTVRPTVSDPAFFQVDMTVTNESVGVWNDDADTNAFYTHTDFSTSAAFTRQWQTTTNISTGAIVDLVGATADTLALTMAESNLFVRVQVVCTDNRWPELTARSATNASDWRLVTGVNQVPTITNGNATLSVTIPEDSGMTNLQLALNLGATDADDGEMLLVWTNLTTPANGTVEFNGTGPNPTTFTYTPTTNWNGAEESFVLQVTDPKGGFDSIRVDVTVLPVNDVPTNTTRPVISGPVMVGSNLTASAGLWSDATDTSVSGSSSLTVTRQWMRAANNVGDMAEPISEATNLTYTLTGLDRGLYINVREMCVDSGVGGPGPLTNTVYAANWLLETSSIPSVVVFNKADSDWANLLNWTPALTPTTNVTAVIGDMVVASPAVASIGSGDYGVKNLTLGTNANSSGTLNMTGGTLTGNGSIALGLGTGSTGVVEMTGGVMTNFSTVTVGNRGDGRLTVGGSGKLYANTINVGSTNNNSVVMVSSTGSMSAGYVYLGNIAGTAGSLILTNSATMRLAAVGHLIVGSAANSIGYLYVRNSATLDNRRDAGGIRQDLTVGNLAGSTGIVEVTGGIITNVSSLTVGSLGKGTMTVGGSATLYSSYLVISGTNVSSEVTLSGTSSTIIDGGSTRIGAGIDSLGTLTVTNSARCSLASTADTLQIGSGSNSTGRVNVNGGTLYRDSPSGRAWRMGYGYGSTGVLTITSGVVSNAGTGAFSVGYQTNSSGQVFLQGGTLYIAGATTLGVSPGSKGEVQVFGGTWRQLGDLKLGGIADATGLVTIANCTQAAIAGAVTVGADGYGLLTISNAMVSGGITAVVTNNGHVEFSGTGSVFRVNTLAVKNNGTVTNYIRAHSGGVDVTNSASTALVLVDGGKMHLAFEENPVAGGSFWGLRWAGDHVATVQAMIDDGRITVSDSSLASALQGKVKVFKNASYTFCGIETINEGSVYRFR